MIATAVGGNSEIVQDGETGLLVPSEDVAALRKALQTLLRDPIRRRDFGSGARRWAQRMVSVEAMTENYERLYREVLPAA